MNLDLLKTIKLCSSSFSNWWFPAHLTDLLYHTGKLDNEKMKYGERLREFLLLDYASSLFSHERLVDTFLFDNFSLFFTFSLWQVGVAYLDQCKVYGKRYMQRLLENIPIQSEYKARKVLRICQERGITDSCK